MENALLIIVALAVAAVGAYNSVHCRHELENQKRRRRSDP